jgi:hypothetical protein
MGLRFCGVSDQQAFPLFLLLGSFTHELQMMDYGPFRELELFPHQIGKKESMSRSPIGFEMFLNCVKIL